MKKRALALLLTLGLGTSLFAYGPGGNNSRGDCVNQKRSGAGVFKLVKELDLTGDQRTALRLAKKDQRAQMGANKKGSKQNRKAMRNQMKPDMSLFMSADKFDKKAFKQEMTKRAEARRAAMQARRAQMLEARADHMQKVFDILTPKQRIKWIELSKEL